MSDCRGFGRVGKLRELGGSINLDIYTSRPRSTILLIDLIDAEQYTEGTESDEEIQHLETDVSKVAREEVIEEETVIKFEKELEIEDGEEDFDFFNLKEGNKNKQLVVSHNF